MVFIAIVNPCSKMTEYICEFFSLSTLNILYAIIDSKVL